MHFAVRDDHGNVVNSAGSNILPGLPPGGHMHSFCVNGVWFPVAQKIEITGHEITIPLDVIKSALRNGAPRKAPLMAVRTPPPIQSA